MEGETNLTSETRELIGLNTAELAKLPVMQEHPAFRARQLASWIYGRGVRSFAEMSDLSRPLRAALDESYSLERLAIREMRSQVTGQLASISSI